MTVYIGIDLHSNNSMVVVIDEKGKRLHERRLRNELPLIVEDLAPFRKRCSGVVVESTFNWYWLVDGLMEEGYDVHLANTAAIQKYCELKYSDDKTDARWLAEMLRVGVLKEGYIYPREGRALRDLLRKRSQLVQQKTAQMLSIQGLVSRSVGVSLSGNQVKTLTAWDLKELLPDPLVVQAVMSNLKVYRCLVKEVRELERAVLARAKRHPDFRSLLGVPGIGHVLGLTILLETGDINRFPGVGNYASYCRCVGSQRRSNGKKKGKGNTKNGNRYLAWAYVEAANYAIRFHPKIQRFYERKRRKTGRLVAIKTVAHKIARGCYHVLKNNVPFEVERAFA
jgi:transposase